MFRFITILIFISIKLTEMDSIGKEVLKKIIPPVFVAHGGGPMPLLGDPYHADMIKAMKNLPKLIPRPNAILVISAHWEEKFFTLLETPNPDLLFDYYGFPDECYKYKYPAPLATKVNSRIKYLFESSEIKLKSEKQRGYDHGVFVPLLLAYPEADIPVTQISLNSSLDPELHFRVGEIISTLSQDGVLILCSGLSFHNMKGFFSPSKEIINASIEFHNYLKDALANKNYSNDERKEKLVKWSSIKEGRLCHPREEHLVPLFTAAGAGLSNRATVVEFKIMNYDTMNVIFNLQ
jgi:aromatic ring-opening dioxygenase catalytic subunit (LigB family)